METKKYILLIFITLTSTIILENIKIKLPYDNILSSKTFLTILFITLIYYTYKKDKYKSIILLIGESTNILLTLLLKQIFQQPRPTNITEGYSFPSGHSSFVFFLIPYAFKINKKIGYTYLTISILVAYSRISLKAHYPIDITVGALIGYTLSYITLKYYKKTQNFKN